MYEHQQISKKLFKALIKKNNVKQIYIFSFLVFHFASAG